MPEKPVVAEDETESQPEGESPFDNSDQLPIEEQMRKSAEAEQADDNDDDDADDSADDSDDSTDDSLDDQSSKLTPAVMLKIMSSQTEQISRLQKAIESMQEKGQVPKEEDFTYNVGPILDPEEHGYEKSLRTALEANGKLLVGEQRKLRTYATKIQSDLQDLKDYIQVEFIKMKMNVSDEEEDRAAKWAEKHGFSYETSKQLVDMLTLYREVVGKETKRKKDRKAALVNGNPPTESVTGATRESEDKSLDTVSGDPFDRIFAAAKKKTFRDLRHAAA